MNALRAFEAAARLGRMTAAADELSVTPGAISRQVGQLETSIGTNLFEGSRHNPQLTPAGTALMQSLSAAFDEIEAAVRAVSENDSGVIDVACYSTFTVKWLLPRLYEFNAVFPDIEVRLSTTERTPDIRRERYDLIITVDAEVPATGVVTMPLFTEQLGPVLTPSLAATLRLRKPKDLAGKPLLHTRTRRNMWQMWCDAAGCALPAQRGPEYEHLYFALEAAVGGLGICVAPWHLVIDDIRAGRLVAPFGFVESGYRYVAVRRRAANRRLDRFNAWLTEQARDMPQP
jgi:DNA-binding transcriptional LysR family regulator